MVDALAVARGIGEQEDLNAAAGAARDEEIAGIGLCSDDFGKMEDADLAFRIAVFGGYHGIARLPIGAAGVPGGTVAGMDGSALAEQFMQE